MFLFYFVTVLVLFSCILINIFYLFINNKKYQSIILLLKKDDSKTSETYHYKDFNIPSMYSPFPQTISESLFFLSSLSLESNLEEERVVVFINFIKKMYERVNSHKKNISNLLISNIESGCFKNFMSDDIYLKQAFPPLSLNEMPNFVHQLMSEYQSLNNVNNIIIPNPYTALLLILFPPFLNHCKKSMHGDLIFPIYKNNCMLSLGWSDGFRNTESLDGRFFRWAVDKNNAHNILLCNNTLNIQVIKISFNIHRPQFPSQSSKLNIVILDECFEFHFYTEQHIELVVKIPPGKHTLFFTYKGPLFQPEGYSKFLLFSIFDFEISINSHNFTLSGKQAYQNQSERLRYMPEISDGFIRSLLHKHGFFEIEAFATNTLNNQYISLETTRFHIIDGYYKYETDNHSDQILTDKYPVNWYIAKRKAAWNPNQVEIIDTKYVQTEN